MMAPCLSRHAVAALLAVLTLVSVTPASATAALESGRLADAVSQRWMTLQNDDGSFPDSIRQTVGWGRYSEAALGYGLILNGIRTNHPEQVDAGVRAHRWLMAKYEDRPSVFEDYLIASSFNVMREHAPRRPLFEQAEHIYISYMQSMHPVFLGEDPKGLVNKYLVEAVAYLELYRTGITSPDAAAVLYDREWARMQALKVINRNVPARVRTRRSEAMGLRTTALSDPGDQPLAYHGLAAGFLARAIQLAGSDAAVDARRALEIAVRTSWAYMAPDGDVTYFGRSQGQAWSLVLHAYAAERLAAMSCTSYGRYLPTAERALDRVRALHPVTSDGLAIVPSSAGAGVSAAPGLDDYAGQAVYNGLTLASLNWAAEAEARLADCRSDSDILGNRADWGATFAFDRSAFAVSRSSRVWMAVKRQGSDSTDLRYASGIVALKYDSGGGRWRDLLARPPISAKLMVVGPALKTRHGLAYPAATSMRAGAFGVDLHGGWRTSSGRWIRRRMRFTYRLTPRGAVISFATRAHDRIIYGSFTRAAPVFSPRTFRDQDGTKTGFSRTLIGRAESGPYASASSLAIRQIVVQLKAAPGELRIGIDAS